MKVRIARIKKEHIPEIGLKGVVDAIIFKHDGEYFRFCSYGKRLSQKGRKFSSRRWISRNSISLSTFRNYNHLLGECLYKIKTEYIELAELLSMFSHYRKYIEGCGVRLNIHLVEDFDVIEDVNSSYSK
jgi:hypothetical protein